LDNKKKGRRLRELTQIEREEKKTGVDELAGLLRDHPVVIHNTAKRTFIAAPMKWQQQNWEVYKRISALVFMDPEIFRFISAHPAGKIIGKNIKL